MGGEGGEDRRGKGEFVEKEHFQQESSRHFITGISMYHDHIVIIGFDFAL